MEQIAESPRAANEQLEPDFNRKIMEKINDFFNDKKFLDVAFNVANPTNTVSAHRLILAAASPYFRRIFNSAEGKCSEITLAGIDSEEFTRLIDCCYNDKASLTTVNVGCMLKVAMQLELTDAVTECANYLMEHISEYTLRKALALVNETGCEILDKRITDYIAANFEKLSRDTVNELSDQQMQTVLLNPVMRTYDQAILFLVIKRWYEHDKPARELVLPHLIGSLQLVDFGTKFLVKQIKPLPGCADLVAKAIMGREEENCLLVRNISRGVKQNFLRYNMAEDEWIKCDVKSDAFKAWDSVYFNKKIYYIEYNSGPKMCSFDLQTKTKRSLPPMLNIHYLKYVVLLDEKIYAMGTQIGYYNGSLSMEMFNPSTDEWQTKADMLKERWGLGAVALNGKIYVIGGEDMETNQITRDVQSYDPKTNIWTECAPLAESRLFPGAAVHNGHIYVLGGYSDPEFTSSVERYNPERNEWTKIGSLNEARRNICGISFSNELLAIGGYNASGYISKIEVYDEENDKWFENKELPSRDAFNAYVVPTALINSIQ